MHRLYKNFLENKHDLQKNETWVQVVGNTLFKDSHSTRRKSLQQSLLQSSSKSNPIATVTWIADKAMEMFMKSVDLLNRTVDGWNFLCFKDFGSN